MALHSALKQQKFRKIRKTSNPQKENGPKTGNPQVKNQARIRGKTASLAILQCLAGRGMHSEYESYPKCYSCFTAGETNLTCIH